MILVEVFKRKLGIFGESFKVKKRVSIMANQANCNMKLKLI